ncbi:MAG: hypothetical protein WDO14_03795 [Bacteroidota bacterium]
MGLAEGEQPTFSQNIAFMFSHQIGWMYVRYFFWNFSGRESDEQNADWISPLAAFEKNIPTAIKENRGRNQYYMIPFLLASSACSINW